MRQFFRIRKLLSLETQYHQLMKHKLNFLAVFFLLAFANLEAQNTTTVQAFTYESTTRDTVISFPEGDHNNYEKIIMHYAMRCKDGLVSTPTDRNLGCGEWDYSCNTNIIDSTHIDSIQATALTHVISNFSGDEFPYTTEATYSYYQSELLNNEIIQINNEELYSVNSGSDVNTDIFQSESKNLKAFMIYEASKLINEGMTAGPIHHLSFESDANEGSFSRLRIYLKNTLENIVDTARPDFENLEEVYYNDATLSANGSQQFVFHTPFIWDGASNILIQLSYRNGEDGPSYLSSTSVSESQVMVSNQEDLNLELNGAQFLSNDGPLTSISNEITISFWSFGNNTLPVNTTIFEGVDGSNRRQVNVHLPWNNGQVYWDCGNDGGGYDRINKPANEEDFKKKWNHWAFVKNATSGIMEIYLNGQLWHSGTNAFRPIDIQKFVLGGNAAKSLAYPGKIDDFNIWAKALNQDEINQWMFKEINSTHPQYEHLVASYNFDSANETMQTDLSTNNYNLTAEGQLVYRSWLGDEKIKNFNVSNLLPNLTLGSGDYEMNNTSQVVLDSIVNPPNRIQSYFVEGTDLILDETSFAYEAGAMPVYNEACEQIGTIDVDAMDIIDIDTLDYYRKSPSKFEIMSFVTPYGIFLDLGPDGKSWTFDVTDFGPILKGDKRLFMDRGGQWQEDMDIKFVFHEGTPQRDVIDIQQVWPVSSENYIVLSEDRKFEPRSFVPNADAQQFKLKAVVTGHGQEGEFIPQTHFFNLNGGTPELQWQIWSECSENPIYPQGGTWIFDRAGWCPGEASHVQEYELEGIFVPGEPIELDYGIQSSPFGDSRYIINTQVVSYGPNNFELDAALEDVIYPSNKVEYTRLNPICDQAMIVVKNRGSNTLTEIQLEYGVEGFPTETYTWTGFIGVSQTKEIDLPLLNAMTLTSDGNFEVRITSVNGQVDEYSNNDEFISPFTAVPKYSKDLTLSFRTNLFPFESSYKVYNQFGEVIHQRNGSSLSANTTYVDDLTNLNGCYKIEAIDTGDDGFAFWANNDGNGYLIMNEPDEVPFLIADDFGGFVNYQFIAGELSNTDDVNEQIGFVNVFPNPSRDVFHLIFDGNQGEMQVMLTDQLGRLVKEFIMPANTTSKELNLESLESGIYFLVMKEKNNLMTKKLIKQ